MPAPRPMAPQAPVVPAPAGVPADAAPVIPVPVAVHPARVIGRVGIRPVAPIAATVSTSITITPASGSPANSGPIGVRETVEVPRRYVRQRVIGDIRDVGRPVDDVIAADVVGRPVDVGVAAVDRPVHIVADVGPVHVVADVGPVADAEVIADARPIRAAAGPITDQAAAGPIAAVPSRPIDDIPRLGRPARTRAPARPIAWRAAGTGAVAADPAEWRPVADPSLAGTVAGIATGVGSAAGIASRVGTAAGIASWVGTTAGVATRIGPVDAAGVATRIGPVDAAGVATRIGPVDAAGVATRIGPVDAAGIAARVGPLHAAAGRSSHVAGIDVRRSIWGIHPGSLRRPGGRPAERGRASEPRHCPPPPRLPTIPPRPRWAWAVPTFTIIASAAASASLVSLVVMVTSMLCGPWYGNRDRGGRVTSVGAVSAP